MISLYGLQACPVLSIPGFGFGCYYSALYIFLVNTFNILFLRIVKLDQFKSINKFFKNDGLILFSIYFISTILALLFLQQMLNMNHLTSKSRAPEILLLASLMLGILQSYGMTWARFKINTSASGKTNKFSRLWANHVLRSIFPFLVVIAALFHFMMSQAIGFNEGRTAPLANHDGFIQQILSLIAFLIIWLLTVLTFHFLSEKDQVKQVQLHFDKLKELQFNYVSKTTYSWGLWLAIIDNLNSFTTILGEKNRLVKSFSKFVTAGVAQQVLKSEVIETKGVVKELTVIMTDIRNFTSISENLKPDQVVTLLNEYFSVMLDVAAKFNISVDKFIGDGILAYVDMGEFSADVTTENRKAIDGALAMIYALDELNIKLKTMNLPEIKIGIGVYRGPLVIGLIGSESKMQHTIIGDTVNRTARLESLCKELGVSIVVSSPIWHSLTSDIQNRFVSFGQVTVKGITTPIEVFGADR